MLHQQIQMKQQDQPRQEAIKPDDGQRDIQQRQVDRRDAQDLLGIGAGDNQVDVQQQRQEGDGEIAQFRRVWLQLSKLGSE